MYLLLKTNSKKYEYEKKKKSTTETSPMASSLYHNIHWTCHSLFPERLLRAHLAVTISSAGTQNEVYYYSMTRDIFVAQAELVQHLKTHLEVPQTEKLSVLNDHLNWELKGS